MHLDLDPGPQHKRAPRSASPWRRIAWLAAGLSCVLGYGLSRDALRGALGLTRTVSPPAPDTLRVMSWNLRRLGDPSASHDVARLRRELAALDPSIVAVQEVYDEASLRRAMPPGEVRLSSHGGHGDQRVGFWWDPRRVRAVGPALQLDEISLGGELRPALAQRFEVSAPAEITEASAAPAMGQLWIITVHLKARPQGFDRRVRQWGYLRAWAAALPGPRAMLVLGDFNTTGDLLVGSAAQRPVDERGQLGRELARAGLAGLNAQTQCSAYWEGPVRDRVMEPSLLDLAFFRGELSPSAVQSAGQCARHSCQSFPSSPAYPDLNYERISDHCPVFVDLKKPGVRAK